MMYISRPILAPPLCIDSESTDCSYPVSSNPAELMVSFVFQHGALNDEAVGAAENIRAAFRAHLGISIIHHNYSATFRKLLLN